MCNVVSICRVQSQCKWGVLLLMKKVCELCSSHSMTRYEWQLDEGISRSRNDSKQLKTE